jgi:hypothetical protein
MLRNETAQLTYTLILFSTGQGATKKLSHFIIEMLLVKSSFLTLHGDSKKLTSLIDKTKCKILNVEHFIFGNSILKS